MKKPFFERVTIIGLGLIGSSLARAIRAKGLADELHGIDSNSASLNYSLNNKIIDFAHRSYSDAITKSDLVLLCAPPSAIIGILKDIAPHLSKNALVMDAGSVKRRIAEQMRETCAGKCAFVPAHPVAGSEKTGPEAGDAALFESRRIILCPQEEELSSPHVALAASFWESIGGKVEYMPAELHDRIYGYVSHLPQLLAYAAKDALASNGGAIVPDSELLRKFTRLGQSDGALWTDIFIENSDVMHSAVDHYLSVTGQIYNEFTAGMVAGEKSESSPESITQLFPRITASCLVTTLSIVEPEIGAKLLRFAGKGLADFTAPVTDAPEDDIERISQHYHDIMPVLRGYMQTITRIRDLIEKRDSEKLRSMLTAIQKKVLA